MSKKIPREAKEWAYECAIQYLRVEECTGDTSDDFRARRWLADKLDRECNRWLKRLKPTKTN